VDFTDFTAILFPISSEVGYLALTLVSFFGSLVPFVPIPSFVLLATMAVGDQFNIHILAISSAVASAAAKQIIFSVSYGGGRIIRGKTRARMKPFERLVKRYGASAAFIAAATPIPDDLVYVPLGLAKYNPKRFFLATLSGKLILHYVVVLIAHFIGLSLLEPIVTELHDSTPIYIGVAAFIGVMIGMIILLLRLDWAKVLGRIAPWTLEEEAEENKDQEDRTEKKNKDEKNVDD